MWVLGVNAPPAGSHDPAACLVDGTGRVHAFCEEERLSRDKHAVGRDPFLATQHCLASAGLDAADVDVLAVGWNMPYAARMYEREWSFDDTTALLQRCLGDRARATTDVIFVRHHSAHAAASFYASPYPTAAVVVADGNGDDESTSIFDADRATGLVRRHAWPKLHSLGWLYDAACRAVGMTHLEAGKLMGLAAYGRARGTVPATLMRVRDGDLLDPPFTVPPDYDYWTVMMAWSAYLEAEVGRPAGLPSDRLDADPVAVAVAWSAQAAIEESVAELVDLARRTTGSMNICLGGGVALNCAANGRLDGPVYVPPVPHDAGVALGAAWSVCPPTSLEPVALSPFLGPGVFSPGVPAPQGHLKVTRTRQEAEGWMPLDWEQVAEALVNGRVGALATGDAEVGPRALGHRSILACPTEAGMRDRVNRLKNREPWRPFAPVALARTAVRLWQDAGELGRYMLGGVAVTPDALALVPAAVHVDGTARVQVVADDAGDPLAELLRVVETRNVPALLNTSLNERGMPIVSSAAQTLELFDRMLDLDFLVLEDQVIGRRSGWWRSA